MGRDLGQTVERIVIKDSLKKIIRGTTHRPFLMALFVGGVVALGLLFSLPGWPLFGQAKTRVSITYGSDYYDFFTTAGTLKEALAEKGIQIGNQDTTDLALAEPLSGQAVKGVIVKALPVTIYDGYQKISGRSVSVDPAEILAANDVITYPEDRIVSDLIMDPVTTGAVGILVKIERAPVYHVYVDGRDYPVRSWDPKVSGLITKSGIKVNPQDELDRGEGTSLLPGEVVTITRINEVDLNVTEAVAYSTTNTTSSSLAFGETRVTQAGSNGQVKKTYHVVYKNGEEVSRWLTGSVVTVPVKNKVVARGSISGKSNWGPYYETNFGGYTTSCHYGYVGHTILITNNANGRQVKVKIVDKGPTNALLDLSTTAFQALGGSISHGHIDSVSIVLLD